MTYEEATKRISELMKALKTGKITDKEKVELARLKIEFPKKGKRQEGGNDFSFWNKFPDLLKDAANVAHNFIPGTKFVTEAGQEYEFANVYITRYMPTPGICEASTDAFNVWSRELYLELHRKYRGLGAYSWEDLAVITFCILDIFGRISEAEFVYGLLNHYPLNSRIRPEGVLSAMGFSGMFINTVKQNLADFRYQINYLIMKSAQLCLPKGMTYLKNRISLNAFMYADSKDKRASYFKFVQDYAFTYYAGFPSGSAAVGYKRNLSSFTSYVMYINSIGSDLDVLLGDTDVARVCSDLLAALGDGEVDKLLLLPEDYNNVALYDDAMLSKFHNMEDLEDFIDSWKIGSEIYSTAEKTDLSNNAPNWVEGESVLLQQQNGNVVFSVQLGNDDIGAGYHKRRGTDHYGMGAVLGGANTIVKVLPSDCHVIDSWQEEPGVDTISEACLWKRNISQIGFEDDSTPVKIIAQTLITSCGPELILNNEVHRVVYGQSISYENAPTIIPVNDVNRTLIDAFTKFDWHPIMFACDSFAYSGAKSIMKTPCIIGDLDNVAPVGAQTVKRVHDVCLLSSFVFDGQTIGK